MSGHVKGFLILLAFVANACASITPPTGGPQDLVPPKLVKSVPDNQTLNYQDRIISLEFDEEVELNDLQKELIITPYTENPYKTKVDKDAVSLEFEKALEPNTTYTFNFRKGIKDLTEGNVAEMPPLTFSTGNYLDSGTVSGTVVKLLNQKPEMEADILLYRAADTGSVKTTKPFYVTRTDASGSYKFTNLATGKYRIFALTDKNNTLTYDQDIERIAFLTDTLTITAKTPPVNLSTIKLDTRKPFIARRTPQSDKAEIEYNEGLLSVRLQNYPPTADSLLYTVYGEQQKTVQVFRKPEQKEMRFIATATDSMGFTATDTVSIIFVKPYKAEKATLFAKAGTAIYTPGQPLTLQASHPIKTVQPGAFRILDDSTEVTTIASEEIKLQKNGLQLVMPSFKLPASMQNFQLVADSSKFTTVTGHVLEPFQLDLKVASANSTGSLKGTVVTQEPFYLLQLLDKDFKVVQSQQNNPVFSYSNLQPGNYILRLIADRNNNGVWDNADAALKKQAEPIYIYQQDLNVRANWELEEITFTAGKPVDNP